MKRPRIEPGPGQESVWDYPRPPIWEEVQKQIRVEFDGVVIAASRRARRVLETSHPPVYYLPPEDVQMQYLHPIDRVTGCEWKGIANYFDVVGPSGRRAKGAAWTYAQPTKNFQGIRNYLAFYPHLMHGCFVDDQQVSPQAGDFYGGWITEDVLGPFKGPPGTMGW